MTENDLKLPWKYKHCDVLSDHGYIVDSDGVEICTIYNIFGSVRYKQVEYVLELVNPKSESAE